MNDPEFVGSREAARRLGVAPETLRSRVRRGDVAVFQDPLDRRKTLVRLADLEPLRHPRPAPRTDEAAEMSVA